MSKDGRLIIDLKMMSDADPVNFKRAVFRFGYHISAAMYIEGVSAHFGVEPMFVCAVCEKGSDTVAFYTPGPELLATAHTDVGRGMAIFAGCTKANEWPGYSTELVEIG